MATLEDLRAENGENEGQFRVSLSALPEWSKMEAAMGKEAGQQSDLAMAIFR